MDIVALLDFICLARGRLDLLAAVELSRDPGLCDGGEPDISPLAPRASSERGHNDVARGSYATGTPACQLFERWKRSGPHILGPSAFLLASFGGWGESVITNVL